MFLFDWFGGKKRFHSQQLSKIQKGVKSNLYFTASSGKINAKIQRLNKTKMSPVKIFLLPRFRLLQLDFCGTCYWLAVIY